ncbi:MAG: hypothetical protein ACYTG0_25750 [Planctomycetota bacterium]|jgi:hypothetical protein
MLPKLTRRAFKRDVGALILGGALAGPLANEQARAEDGASTRNQAKPNDACNFQASFMTWDFPYRKDPRPYARHNIPHGNIARIQLDALIDVIAKETNESERFVLIAPCRAEWVYAENRLFQLPSREYRNVYSLTEQRSMGRGITYDGERSSGRPVSDDFQSLKIDVQTFPRTRVLHTPAEILEATADNVPLVGRTEIDDPAGKHGYVIEYPIKTMNFQPKTNSFQVDTGPVLVPDFNVKADHAIDRLEMAHVAYNRLDRAEFILRRPTPIEDADGKALCQVLHYSEVREDPAATQLLAGEDA